MAKAKQLPSGKWRTRVYSHTEIVNGKEKRIYESFTADTKKESEFMAAKFAMDKNSITKANMTVQEALESYINNKSNILSPATIRPYRLNAKNHYNSIKHIPVDKLTSAMVQAEINALVGKGLSPKTIRNIYMLLISALKEAKPELKIDCKLPQKDKRRITVPTKLDIKKLLEQAKGDPEMTLAIKLGAFMGLRRSEVCAITYDDVDFENKKLFINKALVINEKKEYVVKGTKTASGTRVLDIPEVVLADLKSVPLPLGIKPSQVSDRFIDIAKRGEVKCRFHDLRHYYASVMLSLGVPDKYAMERMGHATPDMLKTVYQHTFEDKQAEITSKLDAFFGAALS